MTPDVVNGQDIGMVQRRRRSRFLFEPLKTVGIGGESRRQDFDRDVATKPRIASTVDLAHSAFAHPVEDLMWTECLTGHNRGLPLGFGETRRSFA